MNDIDLTPILMSKMKSYPRKRGRYNSSELYFINSGATTPEQWLNPSEKKPEEVMKMWNGIGVHNQLEDLLGRRFSERKKEVIYRGIVLVGKVDYEPLQLPNEIWEFKSSSRKMSEPKEWHKHQTKLYLTMFGKDIGRVFQPVKNKEGIYLKHLGMVERDDKWFEAEMEKLYQFHLEVEKLWEEKLKKESIK
jgi:hypothetical protein